MQQFGGNVRGDHDLLIGTIERVERVEKGLERPRFAAEELNIVNEEEVNLAIPAVELGDCAVGPGPLLDRLDELVGELLRVDIAGFVGGKGSASIPMALRSGFLQAGAAEMKEDCTSAWCLGDPKAAPRETFDSPNEVYEVGPY